MYVWTVKDRVKRKRMTKRRHNKTATRVVQFDGSSIVLITYTKNLESLLQHFRSTLAVHQGLH